MTPAQDKKEYAKYTGNLTTFVDQLYRLQSCLCQQQSWNGIATLKGLSSLQLHVSAS